MKKLYYICLTAIVLLAMNNKNSYSQFFVAAIYNDLVAANVNGVENTGNDVRVFSTNTDYNMYIMTWDGDAPGFAWDDALNGYTGTLDIEGVQQGTVTDPDIVLYNDGDMHALIVYLLDDDVYYETWDYDAGANTWNLTNNPSAICSDDCVCPNVDVDETGNTAVVWEKDNRIYAVAGDIQGNFQATLLIKEGHTPDVALNTDPNLTPDPPVNFVYVQDVGTNSYLRSLGTYYSNIFNGWAVGGYNTLYTADLSNNEYFGRPRIAGPIYNIYGPLECEIVVKYYRAGRHYIQSHHINNPSSPEIINNNLPVDISGEINKDPAVSYVGDHIIVSWTYDDAGLGYASSTVDVISRQLYAYDGTLPPPPPPLPPPPPFDVYSVVNRYTNGVQGISSVAGRFSKIPYFEDKLITFFDEDISVVNYKIRPFASTQFRYKQPEIEADIYPNPTINIVNIKIDNDFETAKLELYNLHGQRIIQKAITEQKFELDVSELRSGIYKLRIITDNSSDTKNISIIK
ncbi:MAG: T9SS type A sorting domain-containing protein [Saprospiraceae bacterium]|nr:T9SS type A sorting domain-containing protein [Saprospiraceae bacterium]